MGTVLTGPVKCPGSKSLQLEVSHKDEMLAAVSLAANAKALPKDKTMSGWKP